MPQLAAPRRAPRWVNAAAQLYVVAGGAISAVYSAAWVHEGMHGAAVVAARDAIQPKSPSGPLAELLVPTFVLTAVLLGTWHGQRSLVAEPLSRRAAWVALATATTLTVAAALNANDGLADGCFGAVFAGVGAAVICYRRVESWTGVARTRLPFEVPLLPVYVRPPTPPNPEMVWEGSFGAI